MQAVPESRQQTFEEIYGPPENFLEIEVRNNTPMPKLPRSIRVTDKSETIRNPPLLNPIQPETNLTSYPGP
jgi:hypothetical protein